MEKLYHTILSNDTGSRHGIKNSFIEPDVMKENSHCYNTARNNVHFLPTLPPGGGGKSQVGTYCNVIGL